LEKGITYFTLAHYLLESGTIIYLGTVENERIEVTEKYSLLYTSKFIWSKVDYIFLNQEIECYIDSRNTIFRLYFDWERKDDKKDTVLSNENKDKNITGITVHRNMKFFPPLILDIMNENRENIKIKAILYGRLFFFS